MINSEKFHKVQDAIEEAIYDQPPFCTMPKEIGDIRTNTPQGLAAKRISGLAAMAAIEAMTVSRARRLANLFLELIGFTSVMLFVVLLAWSAGVELVWR